MTAGPARGRPCTFDEHAQDAYLALLATGTRIGDAADKLGISRRTPTQLAGRDRAFAARLANAKQAGRTARIPHGTAGGYTNHACRCRPCTTAAVHSRSNSPDRKGADIHHLPDTQQPTATTKFLTLADVG
ncbi:hypothetical protein [Streptomyces sp. NPDC093589]|uniref:hypothetical protein n=1 Tax=Streptomyces sp. NPDC093589 TaxID=3366043 RepID=UPI0037F4909C